MGRIIKAIPVKLVMGFIYRERAVFNKVKDRLRRKFGRIDFESREIDFNYTDYYEKEFGSFLKRSFISFKKLIPPQDLFKIKLYTNRLERKFLNARKRLVNIDPGYLTPAKLVLASTKDYAHRVYLKKGIFAEITLYYKGDSFRPWEWSYPDFRSADYLEIFNQIRALYK